MSSAGPEASSRRTLEKPDPGDAHIQPRTASLPDLWWSVVMAIVVFVLHHYVPGGDPAPFGVPTGADPGNWLALAHETLGRGVMSADVTYPPVFPRLLAVLVGVLGSLHGLAWSGVLSHLVLIVSVYWITRSLGRPQAMGAALLILFAGYQLEAFAWGSYPQLLATGIALAALHFTVRYMRNGRAFNIVAVAVAAGFLFATHRLISGLFVVAVPIAALHWWWSAQRSTADQVRRAWIVTLGALTMGALQLVIGVLEARTGVTPVLNPLDRQLTSSLWLTTREAVVPWLLVGLLSLSGLWYREWPSRWRGTVSLGVALLISGVIGFVILVEQRVLLWAQIGVVMLAIATVARWWNRLGGRGRRGLSNLLLVASLAVFGSIAVTGLQSFVEATVWYRVVDVESLESLAALQTASEPGDLVIASRGHNGNPFGWWVEGYAQRPAYSAMDVRYAAFPEERRQATLSNLVLSEHLNEKETGALLEEIGARFVVVDKRGPDARWVGEGRRMGLPVIEESDSLVIFAVK